MKPWRFIKPEVSTSLSGIKTKKNKTAPTPLVFKQKISELKKKKNNQNSLQSTAVVIDDVFCTAPK